MTPVTRGNDWPEAPVEGWLETCATLQIWTQIVGKVKLARAPIQNHWWNITLHVTPRGLTTGPMPDGVRAFQIDLDLLAHRLIVTTSEGGRAELPLVSMPLPDFYAAFLAELAGLGIEVRVWPVPVEVAHAVPFTDDPGHSEYRPEIAERLHRILVVADMALSRFRGGFIGKCSPVHFFWGSFDLAVTRFSGRRAPDHPGGVPNLADWVTREAYSHEVPSCGFWPGAAGGFERPAFYAYAYPEPPGFAAAAACPKQAYYSAGLKEFLLPYDEVRRLADPEAAVQAFLESTYAAAAGLGGWDRASLERRSNER
jgi:hypothetical protein